jgi:CelD/BcsL family acetyltransferase involved in cellulose biosynthesis
MLMALNSTYTVTEETFDSISSVWLDSQHRLQWECLFVLPIWINTWWETFGTGLDPYLCAVRHEDELIGIAPFMIKGKKARLIGDTDVCDYLDVVVAPKKGRAFFEVLVTHLRQQGITQLDLGALRADSAVFNDISAVAQNLNCNVSCEPEDVTMELELPPTWDEFLYQLTGKERHEIRRKLRRLEEAGQINLRIVENVADVRDAMDTFLELFRLNRADKAAFMTDQRASFFRLLAEAMAEAHFFKLFFLELNDTPAAAVMCFDYNSTMYLYNSGYDYKFRSLSVGLLSKVFTIKESIKRGKKKYNFLKGTEIYKKRLGGLPVQLYTCHVEL